MKIKFTVPYILSGMLTATLSGNSPSLAGDYASDTSKTTQPMHIAHADTVAWQKIIPFAIDANQHNQDIMHIINVGDTVHRNGDMPAWKFNYSMSENSRPLIATYAGDYSSAATKITQPEQVAKIGAIVWHELNPHAIEAYQHDRDVMYIMNTGDTIRRSGGTLAWRNNNPGNLIYGEFARENGAIGKGPRKFAIFPDAETGRAALSALLRSDSYNKMTIANAIIKYAPPAENDVAQYHNHLKKLTGLNLDTKICNLDSTQISKVTDAICAIEGWCEGNIEERPATPPVMATNNPRNIILQNKMQHTL